MAGSWETSSVEWAASQEKLPGNTRRFLSPCGVNVLVHGLGIEATLLLLHHNHLHDALVHTLVNQNLGMADPRCLADFFTNYGLMDQLARLLEDRSEACAYVLEHFDLDKVPLMYLAAGCARPYDDVARPSIWRGHARPLARPGWLWTTAVAQLTEPIYV